MWRSDLVGQLMEIIEKAQAEHGNKFTDSEVRAMATQIAEDIVICRDEWISSSWC